MRRDDGLTWRFLLSPTLLLSTLVLSALLLSLLLRVAPSLRASLFLLDLSLSLLSSFSLSTRLVSLSPPLLLSLFLLYLLYLPCFPCVLAFFISLVGLGHLREKRSLSPTRMPQPLCLPSRSEWRRPRTASVCRYSISPT